MKTARFKELVAASGRPELHLAWSLPKADQVLQRALKQHRVLTLHQQVRGATKDYGTVGLEIAPHVQYLVFPRSLGPFAGRRIVGIHYDLFRTELSMGSSAPAARKPRPQSAKRSSNVIRFEHPAAPPAAAEPAAKPPAPRQAAEPQAPEEADPVRREIRRAIGDLKAGHSQKARRRLEALVAG